jgi:hypothetical protein
MSVLKKTNDNYDRFILQRSEQQNTLDYFQMKEQLDDITYNDDKMMVDASDDTGNNEKAYNALLQSEILDIGDAIHYDDEKSNENMPTSMTCLQKFSKSRRINKKKYGCFDINADRLFSH